MQATTAHSQRTDSLDSTRERVERLRLDRQLAQEEALLREAEYQANVVPVPFAGLYSNASHRERGVESPILASLAQFRTYVRTGRHLGYESPHVVGLLGNLTDYAVGTGIQYGVMGRDHAKSLVKRAEQWVDRFLEDNDWPGEREAEAFRSTRRDGWSGVVRFRKEGGAFSELRFIDALHLSEPADAQRATEAIRRAGNDLPDDLDFGFGCVTRRDDVEKPLGWFAAYSGGTTSDWDFFPVRQTCVWKANTDRKVKAGLSDLYCVEKYATRLNELILAALDGDRARARIAGIQEFEAGITGDQVAPINDTFKTAVAGSSEIDGDPTRALFHGTPKGRSYKNPPQSKPSETAALALRSMGARWSLPEYVISSDASNNNFASITVAGHPFVKAMESEQVRFSRPVCRMIREGMLDAYRAGYFAGYTDDIDAIRSLMVVARPPEVAVEDRNAATDRRLKLMSAGILGRRTVTAEEGYDPDETRAELDEESRGYDI